jgi:hypothetical protein
MVGLLKPIKNLKGGKDDHVRITDKKQVDTRSRGWHSFAGLNDNLQILRGISAKQFSG